MTSVDVAGLTVRFPFSPYPAQVAYMEGVVRSLDSGHHALLESPTGTGKTLCLLCATLAWLMERRKRGVNGPCASSSATAAPHGVQNSTVESPALPKLVYCSRTHAQLSQVIREFKRTEYRHEFSMVLLASRDRLCVHSEVMKLPTSQSQQAMCDTLRGDKMCRFFRGIQSTTGALLSPDVQLHDIEDLVAEGRKNGFCPYFFERDRAKLADVVFLPYNYVLDSTLRRQLPFELNNAIVVFDEAHNLPSIMASAGCVDLPALSLTNAIHDCSRALAMLRLQRTSKPDTAEECAMNEEAFASLKIVLCRLESSIAALDMSAGSGATQQAGTGELVREAAFMMEFLAGALITPETFGGGAAGMEDAINKAVTVLMQSDKPATGLVRVQQFLEAAFGADGAGEAARFVLQESYDGPQKTLRRTLGHWRLDTSADLHALSSSLHCMLVTSGTLSPMDHFAAELGVPFGTVLKGAHVIQPSQVLGCVLCSGPGGERLNAGFAFRNGVDYRLGLGMSIVNVARNVPGGTLVFFPSYAAMNACVELWRAGSGRPGDTRTVWGMLSDLKPVFVEPTNSGELSAVVRSYQSAVDGAPLRGAILLAVCRGKVSEGFDFADSHGRCVVVTGVPYANHTSLFVRLKREFLTQVAPQRPRVLGKLFTGDDWYRNEAMRAVNQCVGRVIRHKDDYGVVILADERFAEQREALSAWVAPRTTVHRAFRNTYAAVAHFFGLFRGVSSTASLYDTPQLVVPHRGSDTVTPSSTDIPASAELARSFVLAQEKRRQEQEDIRQRRRVEEVNEVPCHSHGGGASCSHESCATENHSGPPRQRMQKQTLAELVRPPLVPCMREAPEMSLGTTSKEFCAFLRHRLASSRYEVFKQLLKDIASIRDLASSSPERAQERFAVTVSDLINLFKEVSSDRLGELLNGFGQHIPSVFRPQYAKLVGDHIVRSV